MRRPEATGVASADMQGPGGPRRVRVAAHELRRVRVGRDAMALLLAKLGWRGSLVDWLEMLDRLEGRTDELRHFRTVVPQLFVVEILSGAGAGGSAGGSDARGATEAAERHLIEAANIVNLRWRQRTGRPLIVVTAA